MMFQMIGEGEKMGSGVSKILAAWTENLWRSPLLRSEPGEAGGPAFTELKLPMVSLVPPETMAELRDRFGAAFLALDETERLALATAAIEGKVTHQRLRQLSNMHPRDLTIRLQGLMRRRFLEPDGSQHPKGHRLREATEVLPLFRAAEAESLNSHTMGPELPYSEERSHTADLGSDISDVEKRSLQAIAAPLRGLRRVSAEVMRATILRLCQGRFLTPKAIATLLDRPVASLQTNYLGPMVGQGLLERKYPERPNHPEQAYRSV